MRGALILAAVLMATPARAEGGRYLLGGAAGWMSWDTAYGGEANGLTFRLHGRRPLTGLVPGGDWLSLGVALDSGWLHEGTRQLDFWNTQTCLAAPLGLVHSFERVRVQLELEPGLVVETRRIRDRNRPARDGVRVGPSLGLLGGLGLAYQDVAIAFVQGGVRFRSGRMDILVLLGIDWWW